MAALSTLIAGLGAAGGLMSGLLGRSGGGNNSNVAMISMMENAVRMQQVRLDAERRRRDVIRQSQVATAQAENNAANAGASNTSALAGATASISDQATVNLQGINQNEQLAEQLYALEGARGKALWDNSQSQARTAGRMSLINAFAKSAGGIGKIADFGWGKLGGFFDGTDNGGWTQSNDIYQVGGNA